MSATPRSRRALALAACLSLVPISSAQQTQSHDCRRPDLPTGCQTLNPPADQRVTLHVYAQGVQVYRWDASTSRWVFREPIAILYADPHFTAPIGVHFVGPTWMTVSGSQVVGAVQTRCTPEPNAIDWLMLGAVSSSGPGPLARTTYIQRIDTVGGLAPARPGTADEIVSVPYTAEYWFYRQR